MATDTQLLNLAESRVGEKYVNVLVPKDNGNWHGPWDCAEFVSWVVFQAVGKLYGCTDDHGNPATTEAYSGAWVRDAENGTLIKTDRAAANNTPGVILIRRPPMAGSMGHIALTDGKGGTVEAAGTGLGVCRKKVEGRDWDYFCKIPDVDYNASGAAVPVKPLPYLLKLTHPNMEGDVVKSVQNALEAAGFDPGDIDGVYGPHTVSAVYAFQRMNRLVADGVVGPATAKKLGVPWPA